MQPETTRIFGHVAKADVTAATPNPKMGVILLVGLISRGVNVAVMLRRHRAIATSMKPYSHSQVSVGEVTQIQIKTKKQEKYQPQWSTRVAHGND